MEAATAVATAEEALGGAKAVEAMEGAKAGAAMEGVMEGVVREVATAVVAKGASGRSRRRARARTLR